MKVIHVARSSVAQPSDEIITIAYDRDAPLGMIDIQSDYPNDPDAHLVVILRTIAHLRSYVHAYTAAARGDRSSS